MIPYLYSLVFRILSGEPYRKTTPTQLRWYSGFFCFLPVFMFGFGRLGEPLLDRANGLRVWFYVIGTTLVLGLCLFVWAKYVPAMASWILGVIVWTIAFVLSFSGKL
jgi:hypothetical protein